MLRMRKRRKWRWTTKLRSKFTKSDIQECPCECQHFSILMWGKTWRRSHGKDTIIEYMHYL